VTGTPGTGKTLFSTRLAKQLNAQHLPLGEYVTNQRLYTNIDRRRKSKIVDIAKTRRAVRHIISENICLIVDTHIPEGIIADSETRMVFVLRCNPKILENRLRRRKWSCEKVKENVMAEILDSCLISAEANYSKKKVIQLNSSHASVNNSVKLAIDILSGKRSSNLSINWLKKIQTDKTFRKYLKW